MKAYKFLMATMAAGALLTTGCREDFAELNQSPSAVTVGNISFLFAEAVNQFEPQGYLEYYYNAPMKYQWCGMGISTSGASEGMTTLTPDGDQNGNYLNVLRVVKNMEHVAEGQTPEEQAANEPYIAAANVLSIYLGIFATDMYGSIPYTEACQAAYGGTITPSYDRVEDLYTLWLTQLDDCVAKLSKSGAMMKNTQDVVYGGDCAKWAKFANSLKLRIAVRLLAQKPDQAKQIAAAVKGAACGYIADVDDDVRFGKGENKLTGDDGYTRDRIYHWSNGFTGCAATESVVNFMVGNQDPRVRFFYNKNQWSSKIVQGYLDQGKELPEQIKQNVVLSEDGKTFIKWGGLGEPWVRYYGLTEDWQAQKDDTGKYKWFFPSSYSKNVQECQIFNKDGGNGTNYQLYSTLNQMMIIGRQYSADQVATLPDDSYSFQTNDRPWTGMYLSAAEVNLYLAEFAMLAGNEGEAKTFYEKALRCSVESNDKLAAANKIAYYSSEKGCFGYDPNEGAIDLKAGEIETMLQQPGYAFTGTAAEKLEKIYIQEMLNFTLYPNEVFITARRSGYPAYNSTLLARKQYNVNPLPRRFPTGAVTEMDKMKDQRNAAYSEQGLTVSSSGMYFPTLNTERLWADKGAPEWGAGAR